MAKSNSFELYSLRLYKTSNLVIKLKLDLSVNSLEKLSQSFLGAAKMNEPLSQYVSSYEVLEIEAIQNSLKTDEEKKCFWINTYNAFTLYLLSKNNGSYGDRSTFFKSKSFTIAGILFSLDDVEHGILRRSKHKYSLGYFGKLFVPSWERKLRVHKLDYRIHFALNCGAVSCPPIKFYSISEIERELDLATSSFLLAEVNYDEEKNVAAIPALFKWYAADFGGKEGVLRILKQYRVIEDSILPSIDYSTYNWQVSENPFFSP